jgi:hypothetical protein
MGMGIALARVISPIIGTPRFHAKSINIEFIDVELIDVEFINLELIDVEPMSSELVLRIAP